jgi:membrane-bound lytic murein transglycosylase D
MLAFCVGLAGCARGPAEPVASVVPPAPTPRVELTPLVSAALPSDSAADDAVLDELREMAFGSLGKNADHLRGVVTFPDPRALERDGLTTTAGGPAAAMPTYDIDVVSFAAHERVKYYMDYFQGPARERFNIWLGRLARYEGMIRTRFRARGVPEDMVYLALVASGYSNTAVSRANAVGMWQFIRSTGRLYDLRIDTWVDERRDPFKATEAAAAHLADLNDQFGSWYLAAAAYNGGAGRVSRGIRRLRVDEPSDGTFFDLSDRRYIRRETRDYVPKLIAAALMAKTPQLYGFAAESIPKYSAYVFDEITVPDATGLDVVATLADTSVAAIVDLNPHFVRGVTPPNERAMVRVPRGAGPRVLDQYAVLPPSERVNFLEHVVRRGETLSEIGQRYGLSVSLIRSANGNVDPRRLRIGRRLVIPVSRAARVQASSGRAPRPTRGVTGMRVHVVRRGDTLWDLSQRFGVRIVDLRRWNDLADRDVLRVGQRLQVTPGPN